LSAAVKKGKLVAWENLVEDPPPFMDKNISFLKTHLAGSGHQEKGNTGRRDPDLRRSRSSKTLQQWTCCSKTLLLYIPLSLPP
jgi:hypothetical protein